MCCVRSGKIRSVVGLWIIKCTSSKNFNAFLGNRASRVNSKIPRNTKSSKNRDWFVHIFYCCLLLACRQMFSCFFFSNALNVYIKVLQLPWVSNHLIMTEAGMAAMLTQFSAARIKIILFYRCWLNLQSTQSSLAWRSSMHLSQGQCWLDECFESDLASLALSQSFTVNWSRCDVTMWQKYIHKKRPGTRDPENEWPRCKIKA